MKKNLLALFALSGLFSTIYAQDTYINDAVVVKVNPNTLFYNGGNVNITAATVDAKTEKIINEGNIQVVGNFTNTNTTGDNFVNRYGVGTSNNLYGQLIIDETSSVTGKIKIEKSKVDVTANDYVLFGLPYQNESVKSIIDNISSTVSFQGNCAVDTNCGENRYNQTALIWDVKETEYDAVTNTSANIPGANYTFNVKNGSLRTFIQSLGSATKFGTYGTPNNKVTPFDYTGTNASTIKGLSQTEFSDITWGNWKDKINNYNERYKSYLGEANANTNARFGKNLHRFSNPFTSNLDLSDISTTNTWVKIFVNGTERNPTDLYDTTIRFKVTKLPSDYYVNWNNNDGTTNSDKSSFISAYLEKSSDSDAAGAPYFWAGNPDALIIKPFEYFTIDYYTLIKANLGNSNIVNAKYNFNDTQKTFDYNFSSRAGGNAGQYARNINSNTTFSEDNVSSKALYAGNTFTQVEFFLLNDRKIQGEAAYLVNSNFYSTGTKSSTENKIENPIFLYEEDKEGNVVETSQTLLNQFNSQDYVGKPLRIGFNELIEGSEYKINLRLFEKSILNQVNDLSLGKYYLLDKVKNDVIEVDANTQISFIADNKINDRFELYWNEKPSKTLSTDDLTKAVTTDLYTDNNKKQFIRFEQSNTTADIVVFDLTGRQIFSKKAVSTNSDYELDLNNAPSVYVVKITYKDGKSVTKKTIKK